MGADALDVVGLAICVAMLGWGVVLALQERARRRRCRHTEEDE